MKERDAIILGALLHDIGKFVQRADENPKRMTHQEFGGDFFQNHFREKLAQSEIFSIDELNKIESAIRNHHNYVEFISPADWLSAGMDRIPLEKEEKGKPQFERLQSLLEKIYFLDVNIKLRTQKEKGKFGHKLAILSLQKEDIFPNKFPKNSLQEEYKNLWEEFVNEIDSLPIKNSNIFISSLYYLLYKYTWCIPSATYENEPDISLFDHLKTTAAIAMCLYDWGKAKHNKEDFTLICGDISGIQNFIYTITSKGAAKGLKGRSFYLQLLAEAMGKYILRQIEYPITNMLYASGGKFYLLVANKYEEKLRKIREDINKGLLSKYDGELYMAIGCCSFPRTDFLENKFSSKLNRAGKEANKQKMRKFTEMDYEHIFLPFGKGGKEKTCEICKREGNLKSYGKKEPELQLCENCLETEQLGEDLKDSNYIAEVYMENRNSIKKMGFDIPFLKTKYYFLINSQELTGIDAREIVLYKLNTTEFLPGKDNIAPYTYGFKFIGGNFIQRDRKGNALTFNDYAERSKGIKRLGILRMDIDNLGIIFAKGFEKNGSISRVTSLSRNISLFFEGYLNQICQKEEYKDNVFIIYSGGDDLFIVGSWNKIVDLAENINEEFRDFTCQNRCLTLSGGISLIAKKHPIHKGAQYAGEAEKMAKDYKRETEEKNAVTFLNKPVSWNDFEICRKIKGLLYSCIEKRKEDNERNTKKLTKGILDRLRRIYLLYDRNKDVQLSSKKENLSLDTIKERIKYNKWLWRMVYSLDRYGRQNDIFKKEIVKIKTALINDQFDDIKSEREIIDLIDIPIRWVEFLTRKEE